jgi:hypothetical protein
MRLGSHSQQIGTFFSIVASFASALLHLLFTQRRLFFESVAILLLLFFH